MVLCAHPGEDRAILYGMMPFAPIDGRPRVPADARPTRSRSRLLPAAWQAAILALCVLLAPFHVASGQDEGGRQGPILLIDIKGAIGFVAVDQLNRALNAAVEQGSPAVIVRLDTPGGLLSSTRDMIHAILSSRVPVIMYVAPSGSRAASAGTYLMYASHIAAMAPGTHIGAATPIALTTPGLPEPRPSEPSPDSEKKNEPSPATVSDRKSVNDAVAYIRSLAELRGRNADWGEKAVREAATLTASAAFKEHVIDALANDLDAIKSQVDGRVVTTAAGDVRLAIKDRPIVEIKPDWKMELMAVITDPNIALILLMIGMYGLLFEFLNPGAIAPGVIGGICLLVALAALSVLPVNYAGLALILFGFALMAAEAFMPGFGVAGLGGIAAFVVGALFLFDPEQSDIPITVSWQIVAGLALVSAAFFAGVLGAATRVRHRPVRTGAEHLIGQTGKVVSWNEGAGFVHVDGERWEAQSRQPLSKGQAVRVIGRTGLVLIVEAQS